MCKEGSLEVCEANRVIVIDTRPEALQLELIFIPKEKGDYQNIEFLVDGEVARDFIVSPFELIVIDGEREALPEKGIDRLIDSKDLTGWNLIILSGFSGTGKGTIYETLNDYLDSGLKRILLYTTRTCKKKSGEKEGIDYHFCSKEEFNKIFVKNEGVYTEIHGNLYGVLKKDIQEALSGGEPCIVEVGQALTLEIKSEYPQSTMVFMQPLLEKDIQEGMLKNKKSRIQILQDELRFRLELRGRDTQDSIENRLRTAEKELPEAEKFDLLIGNPRYALSHARDAFTKLIKGNLAIYKAIKVISGDSKLRNISHRRLLSEIEEDCIFQLINGLEEFAFRCTDPFQRARAYKLISDAMDHFVRAGLMFGRQFKVRYKAALVKSYEDLAMQTLYRESFKIHTRITTPMVMPQALRDKEIVVQAPLRVDLAHGGGSDLFAICADRGGLAINFAIRLGDARIIARVRRIDEPKIILSSKDLHRIEIIAEKEDILNFREKNEPLRLLKSALVVTDIINEEDPRTLEEILIAFGGGLQIITETGVPEGSGLGTSGILEAVLLASLFKISGREVNKEEIVDYTLYMEQILGIGGGWQDPIGGIYGGVKVITSPPGLVPAPAINQIKLTQAAIKGLENRIVLCYSGRSHFAGDLLTKLVGDYLSRSEAEFEARKRLEEMNGDILKALQNADFDKLGYLLSKFSEDFKILNPAVSVDNIELVFNAVNDLIAGGKVCGAGGGGFIILITKEGKRQVLVDRLNKLFQKNDYLRENNAAVYDFCISQEGLSIDLVPSEKGSNGGHLW